MTAPQYPMAVSRLRSAKEKTCQDAAAWWQRGEDIMSKRSTARECRFAVQCFRKAAADGHIEAKYCLACCYSEGLGVRKSPTMEVRWLKRAAQAGHGYAAHNLGFAYIEGQGIRTYVPRVAL